MTAARSTPIDEAIRFVATDAAVSVACVVFPPVAGILRTYHLARVMRGSFDLDTADPRTELTRLGKRRCDGGPHEVDEDLCEVCLCKNCQAKRDRVKA